MSRFGDQFVARLRCRICPRPARSLFLLGRKRQEITAAPAVSLSGRYRAGAAHFVLCKARRLCYTLPVANPRFRLFLGSSAVEHSTVNRMVAGSNPARGAKQTNHLAQKSESRKVAVSGREWPLGRLSTKPFSSPDEDVLKQTGATQTPLDNGCDHGVHLQPHLPRVPQ